MGGVPVFPAAFLLSLALLLAGTSRAIDPETLPEVGYHPGGIAYWDTPFFANAFHNAPGWIEYQEGQWGSSVPIWNNPQFNENGYPRYLNPDRRLRALVFGLHVENDNRPSHWPRRRATAQGRVVVEWQGNADIRASSGGTFGGPGNETGRIDNGRRVYTYGPNSHLQWIEIHDIDPDDPITDIKVWLSDPDNSESASQEGALFHATFLARLADAPWGVVRLMNMTNTNASPEQDWSDRRRPGHAFMTGVLNPRSPAEGSPGNRETGIAWEHAVALSNQSGHDLWINIPHLATDDYVRNLARLIRHGSDGTDPYTEPTTDPIHAPLNVNRRVYLELSNEIWASGYSFPQGDWAQQQATALGITKPQFNARRFCEVWRIFQEEFGGNERLVRVAAIFTAADWYTRPFLEEIAAFGPTLTPPVTPDVIAVTTYFGNGIQDFAYDRAQIQAASDDRWFLLDETFDAGGGTMRPVSVAAKDPYWSSETLERHLNETFDEWVRRLLSGDAREGAGPDAVGVGGGFDLWVVDLANTLFPTPIPVVAYEGGPSLYTDNLDGGDPRDDGLTTFMEALNRHPRFREVYEIHLNMAEAKGLWTHMMFVDSGRWGKYGQWGHLEYLDQNPDDAVKYRFLLDWISEAATRNHPSRPVGDTPEWNTPHNLPVAVYGEAYSAEIAYDGADAPLSLDIIAQLLPDGIQLAPAAGENRVLVSGTPTVGGLGYLQLRITDADGDPNWRTFTVRTVGGPNTILESNLEGTNPGRALPWESTYTRAIGLDFSGITRGSGIIPADGDDMIAFSVNAPPEEADSTLALAVADNEYLAFTVAPPEGSTLDLAGHELRLGLRRIDYHAPRRFALLASSDGFQEAQAVFLSPRIDSTDDQELRIVLPDTSSWRNLSQPVEFRLYGYGGQWGGHRMALLSLRLDGTLRGSQNAETWSVD